MKEYIRMGCRSREIVMGGEREWGGGREEVRGGERK